MSFIDTLTREHREFEDTLGAMLKKETLSVEELKPMLKKLHVHMKREEDVLYPEMQEILSPKEEIKQVEDSYEEHGELKDQMIKLLGDPDLTPKEVHGIARSMLEHLEHHHKDEETEMFPSAREQFDELKMKDVTKRMEDYRIEHRGEFISA